MILRKIRCVIDVIVSGAVLVVITGCVAPVENEIDYCELESVWQYLSTYSIYQWDDSTRVPEDPYAFTTAAEMMEAVRDTLNGSHYTHYLVPDPSTDYLNTRADSRKASSGYSTVSAKFLQRPKAIRITISKFTYGVTYPEFIEVSRDAADYDTIIINLRDNGGGDIDETDSIIEAMLPAGVAYLQARNRVYDEATRTAATLDWHNLKTKKTQLAEFRGKTIFVEMNGNSASASEILIAALKEGMDAQLIGSTTYGKGIGQIKIPRRDRRDLQITFLQMRGKSSRIGNYHRKGIEPDASSLEELLGISVLPKVTSAGETGFSASAFTGKPTPVAGYRTIHEYLQL